VNVLHAESMCGLQATFEAFLSLLMLWTEFPLTVVAALDDKTLVN